MLLIILEYRLIAHYNQENVEILTGTITLM